MSDIELDEIEARVLGVLIEKSMTTPEQYPLSLNAATLGANQKSNRDPILSLGESEVHSALHRLIIHHLVGVVRPVGSRVEKFRHNAEEVLRLETGQLAILAELLVRGPQAQGELRTRVNRMQKVESLDHLMRLLSAMIERSLVARVDPAPGSRAERYAQLLCPGSHPREAAVTAPVRESSPSQSAPATSPLAGQVEALESRIERLEQQLGNLAEKLGETL